MPTTSRARKRRNDPTTTYALSVVDGVVVAGALVKAACQRHLDDLEHGPERGLRWNVKEAEYATDFFPFCRHYKGVWAGQPIALSPWQQFIVGSLFGWQRADGTRRYRKGFVGVGRKNGKTTLCGGLGLYGLVADGEAGPEIYAAATKFDQAKLLWRDASVMVKASPDLSGVVGQRLNRLFVDANNGFFIPLGRDSDGQDGLNPHMALIDELHAHPDSGIYDVLSSGMGARSQPLLLAITTAGFNGASFGKLEWDYASSVTRGIIENDSYFAYIATLDEGDDPFDESVWLKANPGLGVSVFWDKLREEAHLAKTAPHKLNNYLTKHMNLWTRQVERWMPMAAWDACVGAVDEAEFTGEACYAGLDLSSTTDITAFVLVFTGADGVATIVPSLYIPEDTIVEHTKKDKVPYEAWAEAGYLKTTPGNVIDHNWIRADILAMAERFKVKEIAFDRWNSSQLVQQLTNDGLTMVATGQGFASMNTATKELMRMVLTGKVRHGAHPVLRWMADNMVVRTDPAGNIKPDKEKATNRIDGMVALIMALDRVIRHEEEAPSVYDARGIRVL